MSRGGGTKVGYVTIVCQLRPALAVGNIHGKVRSSWVTFGWNSFDKYFMRGKMQLITVGGSSVTDFQQISKVLYVGVLWHLTTLVWWKFPRKILQNSTHEAKWTATKISVKKFLRTVEVRPSTPDLLERENMFKVHATLSTRCAHYK